MREFNKINHRQTLPSAKLKDFFQKINNSMHISICREIERLEKGMSFLGSIGSVAPFIGLLGTVWGIVNAFQSIAISNNTSLAVVAPGIAEALFATALGLLAAIPAVAAYNKFSNDLEKLSNNLEYFSIEFSNALLRQVEEN
jgi:biopolymer transport protein TolQ